MLYPLSNLLEITTYYSIFKLSLKVLSYVIKGRIMKNAYQSFFSPSKHPHMQDKYFSEINHEMISYAMSLLIIRYGLAFADLSLIGAYGMLIYLSGVSHWPDIRTMQYCWKCPESHPYNHGTPSEWQRRVLYTWNYPCIKDRCHVLYIFFFDKITANDNYKFHHMMPEKI